MQRALGTVDGTGDRRHHDRVKVLTHDQSLGQNVPLQFSLPTADTAERVIGAIRDEVGTACDIIIGTHGQMTAAGALRIAQRLEKFDPLWYEEPCPPENMNAWQK